MADAEKDVGDPMCGEGRQGARGSETSVEKTKQTFPICRSTEDSICLSSPRIYLSGVSIHFRGFCNGGPVAAEAALYPHASHFRCLKARMEGQLKVDATTFDPRVAGGCVDVAERRRRRCRCCCGAGALAVTLHRTRRNRLQSWNGGTAVSKKKKKKTSQD